MKMNRKSIAIGLVVGVLAGGTGGAIAATSSGAIGHWHTHARDWAGGAWSIRSTGAPWTGATWPGSGTWASGTPGSMTNGRW